MADHNDPNAVNSIFSDIDVSAADLYDIFGFPSADTSGGEKVVIALTFAATPQTGVFDQDMLYRIRIATDRRLVRSSGEEPSLEGLSAYLEAVKNNYLSVLRPSEVRVTFDQNNRASIRFINFPGGDFAAVVDTNRSLGLQSPGGHAIKAYIGGRDDAFFNDLTGFFRSINYAPQFYHVPHTMTGARELPIPKTLLELEGNDLFNFRPDFPTWGFFQKDGTTPKLDLPPGPWEWKGNKFKKDANGDYRFVYDGSDCRAGQNCNAIIVELPHSFITPDPSANRLINAWGESWVLRAAHKVESIPDDTSVAGNPWRAAGEGELDDELRKYKLVDTDGQPFADAGLSEREDDRQLGANNVSLGPAFIRRLAHLGWGFGPSISALGLQTSFDHDNSPGSIHRTYDTAIAAFPRAKKTLFQQLNMPDNSWNPKGLNIPLRRPFEIFVPNVCALDMDTTGTWPFGRRLEDQVANRFLSLFLDMESAGPGGSRYHVETLSDQAVWDAAPIEPKTSPNPLKNDKEI